MKILRNCLRIPLHSLNQKLIFGNFQLNGCDGFHVNLKDILLYKSYGQMSSGSGGTLSSHA